MNVGAIGRGPGERGPLDDGVGQYQGPVAASRASACNAVTMIGRTFLLTLAFGLSACATLEPPTDRPVSSSLAPSADDPLVRAARASVAEPTTGFRLMPL